MRRYFLATAGLLATLLVIVLLVEALELPLLADPGPWLAESGPVAALLGLVLLLADVVLPVPSSLVMIANGALFGVALGTVLSLAGSVGATLLGFAIGRSGGSLLGRVAPREALARVDALLGRWGSLAIVLTRPLPLLAETTAMLAGASSIGWGRATVAALVGSLPAALLYALTGAAAVSVEQGILIAGAATALAVSLWMVGARGRAWPST